jgi:phenylalanyl-tRNA synthetase beta chain
VAYNHNRGSLDLRLFETGKVYRLSGEDLPQEEWQFAAALSGQAAEQTWRSGARKADFYDGKVAAQALLQAFQIGVCEWSRPDDIGAPEIVSLLHPGKCAVAQREGRTLLVVGELHPGIKELLGLKRDVVLLTGSFPTLREQLNAVPTPEQAPQFPAVERDLALVADVNTSAAAIEQAIAKRAKSMLAGLRLFDVYEGEKLGAGKRSLAYQLRFSAPDRTLTDAEVNPVIEKVLAELKEKLGVELRQ